jgi:glycosyltransferase involved in cell wall biosynthesis
MAGPAIRAWEMAGALAATQPVVLASTADVDLASPEFAVVPFSTDLLADASVVLLSGDVVTPYPQVLDVDVPVVVDCYDPAHLELLEQARDEGPERRRLMVAHAVAATSRQLARADLVLCASPRQRDLWLGHLAALGRVSPAVYDEDPSLGSLVALVPFGLPALPPVASVPGPREVVPGIGPDDPLLLWAGGLYNWFDPQLVVRAVDRLRASYPDLRLLFLGGGHPNPAVPAMSTAAATAALVAELGLEQHVFFAEGWVPYGERGSWLLEADVGVCAATDSVENAFSYRTRLLDHLWAGLPTVTTVGDALSELLAEAGAGVATPPGDLDAFVAGVDALLASHRRRVSVGRAATRLAATLTWEQALAPLLAFCAAPRRAPDLLEEPVVAKHTPVRTAVKLLREQGLGAVTRRAAARRHE